MVTAMTDTVDEDCSTTVTATLANSRRISNCDNASR
jgi:hypothetical protein